MTISRDRILTTHVGSLPRGAELSAALFAKDGGEPYDSAAFEALVREEVAAVVRRQADCGIDLVSDGEMSKISYATYIAERLTGFGGNAPRNVPQDLDDYPGYRDKIAASGDTPKLKRPCCIGPVAVRDLAPLDRDLVNLSDAAKASGVAGAFMNSATPGVVSIFQPNQHYPDQDAYLEALADAMKAEYDKIHKAGVVLQLDSPDLAFGRHVIFKDLDEDDFVRRADRQVEVLNHALRDIPAEAMRLHICWGNYEGPHTHDIPMAKVYDTFMKVKPQALLFETSNPRHAHEWRVFQERGVPEDKILIPGCIDSTTNFVEHSDLVAERILRFTDLVGRERVVAGSDCGFSTFAGFGKIETEICYAKLTALSEGAAKASERLWGW
ncbi:MAG: cobalamin-independent methionine synthase II family protein [Rhodospirillales bacterium]